MLLKDSSSSSTSSQQSAITSASVAVAVVAVAAGTTSMILYWKKGCNNNKGDEKKKVVEVNYPPYAKPMHWLWGNAPYMPRMSEGHHIDPKFLEWSKEMNRSVYSVKIPIVGTLMVVADPEWIHHIAVTRNINKSWTYKRGINHIVGEKSIITMPNHPTNKEWKIWRKAFTPGFMPTFLKTCVDIMCQRITDRYLMLLDQEATTTIIDDNNNNNKYSTNMMNHAQTLTSDILVSIAFGEDWFPNGYTDSIHPCREWITQVSKLSIQISNDPFKSIFGYQEKKLRNMYAQKVEKTMNDVLDRRMEKILLSSQTTTKTKNFDRDICSLAIHSILDQKKDEQKQKQKMKRAEEDDHDNQPKQQPILLLSQEDRDTIIDQLKTFYFAGHDTTATTIAWAGWLLSQHPMVVAKLRQELTDAYIFFHSSSSNSNNKDDDDGKNINSATEEKQRYPTYEEIQNCSYLDAVVKEVLRLYPPGASARYTPDLNEQYEGYTLGGAVLYLNVYIMHHLPQYWGDNCDDFIPERFMNVNPSTYNHKYMPFLKGPRDCLGKYFALLEAKLAIAALVQRYDMECVNPNESLGFQNTMHPYGGAKLILKIRQ